MWNGVGQTSLFSKGAVTIRGEENKSFRIRATQKTSGSGKKKKLSYNARELSAQISRARKSKSAAEALGRARSKVSVLKRCLATGQYDSREVQVALAHASKMVECAGKKMRNLRQEEQESRKSEREFRAESGKLKAEAKQKVEKKERDLELSMMQKEAQLERRMKTERQRMLKMRQAHRNEEQGKLNEADMAYIKEKLKSQDSTEERDCGAVMLELSASAMQLSELAQNEQMLKQMELQAAQELAQIEAGAAMPAADVAGTVTNGTIVSETAGSVAPASVDVSL